MQKEAAEQKQHRWEEGKKDIDRLERGGGGGGGGGAFRPSSLPSSLQLNAIASLPIPFPFCPSVRPFFFPSFLPSSQRRSTSTTTHPIRQPTE